MKVNNVLVLCWLVVLINGRQIKIASHSHGRFTAFVENVLTGTVGTQQCLAACWWEGNICNNHEPANSTMTWNKKDIYQ